MTSLNLTLPNEIFLEIFKFLSPEELGRVSCVCKNWHKIGKTESLWKNFNLKILFPKLEIIDEAVWKAHINLDKYQLSFEDTPPNNNRQIIPLLKRLFTNLKIENDAGITLLTMPKGLSYNKVKSFAQSPLRGNPTNFRYTWHHFPDELGDTLIEKNHRVFITNDVVEGSRALSITKQEKLLETLNCQMPNVLPLATLAILTYITSIKNPPKRLLSDHPMTYSRCTDYIDKYRMVCGGYAISGFGVDSFSYSFNSQFCGVVAYLKFDHV